MKRILGLTAIGLLLFAPLAGADTVFSFSTSGTTSGGRAVSGTASFDFTGTQLILTLHNTSNVTLISQELDGIAWSGFSLTGLTPLVAPGGVVNCNGVSGSACTAVTTSTSPYGWAILSGGTELAAGGGSYHPYAIVDTYLAPGGNGGLSNNQHNPLLTGPVTFTFDYTGAPAGVSDVVFYWGTVPDTTRSQLQVAEPASMLLLGTGLLGAGFFGRRRKKR